MKRFFLVSVVLALFGLAANAQPQGLLGTWKTTTIDVLVDGEVIGSVNCSDQGMEMKFVFKANGVGYGVMVVDGDSETKNFKYRVSGTTVYMTNENGEELPFTYSNGKLSLKMEEDGTDVRINFKKLQ
jgi:hypothetical protein